MIARDNFFFTMQHVVTFIVIFLLFVLQGCLPTTSPAKSTPTAVQQATNTILEESLILNQEQTQKIVDLGWPLLTANAKLCGKAARPAIGIQLADKKTLKLFGDSAPASRGYGTEPTVYTVAQQSPADVAGILSGDVLMRINGESIPQKGDRVRLTNKLIAEHLTLGEATTLLVCRNGERLKFEITPVNACAFNIELTTFESNNAFADGKRIMIGSLLVQFMTNEEIQVVIAHELAHNVEAHSAKKAKNSQIGLLVDLVFYAAEINTYGIIAMNINRLFSRQFEREADYIGMYMLANAGLDTSNASLVWRKFGKLNPRKTKRASSHPASGERLANLDATHWEIEKKIQTGKPLLPNRRRQR